jgi:MFS family permease
VLRAPGAHVLKFYPCATRKGSAVTQTQEHADAEQPSPWAPLHNPIYRNLFIASFVSNIGTWMQSVAAQWFLVEKHSSDVIVALVQTASLGPTLVFGLFAGVLADLFDRRRLLIVLQTYAVLVALALAVLTYLGRVGPTALLMFTLAIGCASALTAPAWQAVQPEVVPREQIPAVSTLGSVSGNAARAVGPAIGGVILALAGPAAVFAINAISFAGIIVALLAWKRPKQIAPLEREHFGQAIVTGLLFVNNDPIFRRILLHAALFLFPASALLALLPLVAAHRWHLGASGYGVAVGAVGLGALLAVALAGLRLKLSDNLQLAASAAAYGLAMLAVAWLPFAAALPFLVISGMAWLITLTTLNASAQLSLPRWVRARGLSVYLLVATGSQAIGSYVWGALATRAGLDVALGASAVALGVVVLSVAVLPLQPSTGKLDLEVSTAWPTPTLMFEPCPQDGPVLVAVRYRVSAENLENFVQSMGNVRQSRLRTGGHSWRLYHSVAEPDIFLERFTVASWSEFEHQRTERWLDYDSDGVTRAIGYTVDNARQHEYYLARRVPR